MYKSRPFIFSLIALFLFSFKADKPDSVIDYLSIGDSITFNQKEYHLIWSSNPVQNYCKQEYLPDSSSLDNYHDMIIVEAIKGNLSIDDALNVKIQEVNESSKKSHFMIPWKVYPGENEKVINFCISDGGSVYEWNLYRYIKQKNKKGEYLVLCAFSYRDSLLTNEDRQSFINRITEDGDNYVKALLEVKIPQVKIK